MAILPEGNTSLRDWLKSKDPTGGKIVDFIGGMNIDANPLAGYARKVPYVVSSGLKDKLRVLPGEIDKFRQFLVEKAKEFGTDYSLFPDGITRNLENASFLDSTGSILGGRSWNAGPTHHWPFLRSIVSDSPQTNVALSENFNNFNRLMNDYGMARITPPVSRSSRLVSMDLPMDLTDSQRGTIRSLISDRPAWVELMPYESTGVFGPKVSKNEFPLEQLRFGTEAGSNRFFSKYDETVRNYRDWLQREMGGKSEFEKVYRR
jgi:hypothetical protein